MRRAVVYLALLIGAALLLAGCGETIHGVGKDIERQGKGINTFLFRQQ